MLAGYAARLAAAGGRLYLSGASPELVERLRRTGRLGHEGTLVVVPAEERLGASTSTAVEAAEAWLAETAAPR